MHDVVDTRWHANSLHNLAEQSRGAGRFLRRLHDHGVAASQGRRNLPGHQQQREIPGTDHCNHTTWNADRVVERHPPVGRCHLEALSRHVLDDIREYAEICGAARYVQVRCEGARFTGVLHLRVDKIIGATIDLRGNRFQQGHALRQGHSLPGALQSRLRRLDRQVDLRCAPFRDESDQAAVNRRALLELPSRAAGQELVTDKVRKRQVEHRSATYDRSGCAVE
jgi:hypothetical protein